MSVPQMLYQFIIGPIEILLEVIYGIAYTITSNSGSAIIVMSIALNLLLLPVYNRADLLQKSEKEKEASMKKWVDHIKKTFKGDERYIMLQTYYRQNGYRPIYTLKSAFPLILQIPFFMAAYHFLSNLRELEMTEFGCFSNLSQPDTIFNILGFQIHLLPIVMTIINLISGLVYSKECDEKEKLRMFIIAIFFFVILYDAPSGLVLYWTMNNLFSLFRNIINASKRKEFYSLLSISLLGICAFVYAFMNYKDIYVYELTIGIGLVLQIPIIKSFIGKKENSTNQNDDSESTELRIFVMSSFLFAVLTGVLIPSSIIRSSPAEFIITTEYISPLWYVISAGLLSGGTFIFWGGVIYFVINKKQKYIYELLFCFSSLIALVNYMFFGTKQGNISSYLKYDTGLFFEDREIIINLETILFLVCFLAIIWIKKRKILHFILPITLVSLLVMSFINIHNIISKLYRITDVIENQNTASATITISKTNKNVVVIMLDRAISSYLPYIMQEKPELKNKFDGFTWYPNTLSYGTNTNTVSASVFGGYEYTPEEINRRINSTLKEKQNEALKVMPVLFYNEGYTVTVCDPPYAGYSWIPDLSIYDDYPEINAYNTEYGQFNTEIENNEEKKQLWKRSFFCFGIMKTCPLLFQPLVYTNGSYFEPDINNDYLWHRQITYSISKAIGMEEDFLNSYSVLKELPSITLISDNGKKTFLMLHNKTAHDVALLDEPDYEPSVYIDNTEYDMNNIYRFTYKGRRIRVDNEEQMMHYQCNMASLIKLGEWFDYLREQKVYDNTRIIIVSDHGYPLKQFDDFILRFSNADGKETLTNDIMWFNPLLLVKDFNAKGFKMDESFMTNADVPVIATERVISNPTNPFTGHRIDNAMKTLGEQHVFTTDFWKVEENNGSTFMPGTWFAVSGNNVFEKENWRLYSEE